MTAAAKARVYGCGRAMMPQFWPLPTDLSTSAGCHCFRGLFDTIAFTKGDQAASVCSLQHAGWEQCLLGQAGKIAPGLAWQRLIE